MVLKTLDLLRFNEAVGRLVKLIETVVSELITLLQFFVGWIFVFSVLYQVLGMKITIGLNSIPNLWDFIIYSWKVGTKGPSTSLKSIWDDY